MRVAATKKLLTLGTLVAFSFLVLFSDYGFAQGATPPAEMTAQPAAPQKETETKVPKTEPLPTKADPKAVVQPLKVETKTVGQQPKVEPQTMEMTKKNPAAVVKKKKKFPWLLAILGVGVVVALVVLLGKKKNDPTPTSTATYTNGVLTVNSVRYELASISAGEFQMGSNSSEAEANEQPMHTVLISKAFWMGKTEVTQGLWQAVMGSNPSIFKSGDNYPVETVSWDDCQSFITKLNQMVGGNYFRLPTEAEWEYSCRAGTTGDRYGNIDTIAWYDLNSGKTTHPVGQMQANDWGLFDTLGNVWEWCHDWFEGYSGGYQIDPAGPGSGTIRVLRGGSYFVNAHGVRSPCRAAWGSDRYNENVGFRLARTN